MHAMLHGISDASEIKKIWTHWDLNPGPSACEADVIPLHHVPLVGSQSQKHPGRALSG